ncbi:EAL domain-containing response regulator [Kordiimonas aquimaris]|uniref:EAL domain-containing response regulator n=1 Tax=Kordiimonas aquimaris TaxID=707591 RepID=UPI0021CF5CFE|nr:EAL domain-containing response regulator [Kordiimonas aquimaris]
MTKRILTVDDTASLKDKLSSYLVSSDFFVSGVAGGMQALDVLNTESFDVVIANNRTADFSGFDLIKYVSELERRPSVILVADEDPRLRQEIRDQAMAYSVNLLGVLSAPIDGELLLSALSEVANLGGSDGQASETGIVETEFMRGLMTDGLSPVFQPKINLKTGKMMGAEAFARWSAPGGGLLGAGAVIKVAREKGYMDVLTYRMLELALQQQGKWRREGQDVPLSINTSSENLRKPDFADVVTGLAEQFGVEPSMVRLEITESDFEVDERVPLENLSRLHARGFGLALDDFGTGFAPLLRLKAIPFDELVIDRDFLSRAAEDETAQIIFETAVELAHKLKLNCTVEGIESEAQLTMSKRMGVDTAQGYFIGKPMSSSEFLIWIEDYKDGVITIPGLT